ncbi:MAG: hypothetical protein E7417_03570 [Ruminococcaceae bacterium]|nr:hypothetical protein [Oscillospiraceae bacterium]
MKKFITLLLSAAISLSCIPAVNAAKSVSELKKELAENQKKAEQTEKDIKAKQAEVKTFSEESDKLDVQILALQDDIDSVQAVINEKEAEIVTKNAEIEVYKEEAQKAYNKLKTRMKVIYENGVTSYLELLLEANGIADLFTRVAVVESIVKHDNSMIDNYNAQAAKVEEAKVLVEAERDEQVAAKAILDEKQSAIESKKAEKDQIINSLTNDIAKLKKLEAQMAQAEKQIQNQIDSALKSSTQSAVVYKGSGKFQFPMASYTRMSSPYGYRIHPISKTKKLHTGIDYAAPLGTAIYAADDGVVLTAGWVNGYGYTVSINHGSGYVTLYAHCSKLLVSSGQKVTRGQTIAKVGSTGNSTGNHLHFEVRVNGKTTNPAGYL